MRDPRTWRPLSPFEMLEGGQPPPAAAAMVQAAAAPPSTAAGRILGAVGGAAEGLATLPFLIPQALAGRLQQRIAEGQLATQSLPLRIREMQLANERAEREARLADSQFPAQSGLAAAQARQLSTLDARIAQSADPREREALIRGAATGEFRPYELEPGPAELAAYQNVLGMQQEQARQKLIAQREAEQAAIQNRYQLRQISARGEQDRLTAASKPPEVAGLGDVDRLRGQYFTASGDFIKYRDAFQGVSVAAQDDTGASDLTLLYNFIKLMDPNAVREGELALTERTQSIPASLVQQFNRLREGDILQPEARDALIAQAEGIFGGKLESQLSLEAQFKGAEAAAGITPGRSVFDVVPKELRESGGKVKRKPKGGDVRMRFPDGAVRLVPAADVEKMSQYGEVLQ